ncbi:MAG: hypothetical protein ACP5T2_03445 [Thermoprotei archaeon]
MNFKAVLILLVLGLASAEPVMGATLNAKVYPAEKLAYVVYSESRTYNLTYPASSALSGFLSGRSGSEVVSSEGGPEEGGGPLMGAIREQDPNASVVNYSLTYEISYKGTSTYFVAVQNAALAVWLANVTSINSSKLMVNARWKAFSLRGPWDVKWHNSEFNVNTMSWQDMPFMGSVVGMLGSRGFGFSGRHLGEVMPAFDFSVFSTPLAQWHRSYDPFNGITTFSMNYPANYTLLFKASFNGENYSLSVKQDPSAVIRVVGYAVPQGDYLLVTGAPATVYAPYAAAVAAVAVVAAGVAVYAARKKASSASRAGRASPAGN